MFTISLIHCEAEALNSEVVSQEHISRAARSLTTSPGPEAKPQQHKNQFN